MKKIPSFQKNHDLLERGLYLSTLQNGISTWDLRFKKPNAGDYITPKALHTIEHILATLLRNSPLGENIIYFGPMGCRTGFYLLTTNLDFASVRSLLIHCLRAGAEADEIPGSKREECGNYLEHDLAAAKAEMAEYLALLEREN